MLVPQTTTSTVGLMEYSGSNTGHDGSQLIGSSYYIVPGQWSQIRVHLKAASSAGATNGVSELWVNGALAYQKTNGDFSNLNGGQLNGIYPALLHNGYLMGYTNGWYSVNTTIYIDDFKIYDTDPGWNATGATPIIAEDFSSYANTTTMNANPNKWFLMTEDINQAQISLDTTQGYGTSTKSMKFTYPPAPIDSDYTITRYINFSDYDEIWTEVTAKVSANWTNLNPGATYNPDFKFIFLGIHNKNTGIVDSRFSLKLGTYGISGYNTGTYPLNTPYAVDPNDRAPLVYINTFDGNWHTYKFHTRSNVNGIRTGLYEVSIDDKLILNFTNVDVQSSVWAVRLGANVNQGIAHTQTVNWGSVRVYTTNPGWINITGGAPADTTPPVISNGAPSGTLSAGTASTVMNVTTDEAATCRYSTTANTTYANMTNTFSTTNSTSHSTTISGLTNGNNYTYYVRCIDAAGNANTASTAIAFGVASSTQKTVLFQSDWSTATGNSDAALRDTSKAVPWPVVTNPSGILSVASASGLGFPAGMANVLKVTQTSGAYNYGWCQVNGSDWSAPAIGESLFYRAYLRVDIPDSESIPADYSGNHPLEAGDYYQRSQDTWSWKFGSTSTGKMPISFVSYGPNALQPSYTSTVLFPGSYPGTPLDKFKVYRLEWMVHRYSNNEFRIYPRIYNDAGTLLYDENTMKVDQGYSASMIDHGFTFSGADALTGLAWLDIGSNGPNFNVATTNHIYYWGGVAVCKDNWCGPYNSTQPSDTTPPVISNSQPNNTLPAGTTSIIMNVTTDEVATCKYTTTPNTAYGSMTNSFTDAGTSHSTTINGLQNGTAYNYYVRCNDASGNINTQDYNVSFSTAFFAPDIVDNASFENGWDGFVNGGFNPPDGLTNDTAHAYLGTYAVKKVLPVTDGVNDVDSNLDYPFYAASPLNAFTPAIPSPAQTYNRLWARWYFYLDAPINGTLKFNIWQAGSFGTQFGGLGFVGGNLVWSWLQEWNSQQIQLVPLTSLVNDWHCVEEDYWRNGDTSNAGNDYPSVAVWLDGTRLTSSSVIDSPPSPGAWINNRINAGERKSSETLGVFRLLGLINGAPRNTIPGNIWIDDVAVSSKGRIGCGLASNATGLPPPSQRPGDLNDDGKVDFLDLLIVVGQFRRTGASIANTRADINGDGTVNLFDFVLLAKNWGREYS